MTVKSYSSLPLDLKEAARYAHCPQETLVSGFADCISACEKALVYRICGRAFPIGFLPEALDLGFVQTDSRKLAKNLADCSGVFVFCATVGMELDRLIRKYALLSPAKASVCHAIGSAAVETLCDRFCAELKETFGETRPRFSPGYGDPPLTLQIDVFSAISPEKHIGVTLGENLIMTPTKSVTAFVGLQTKEDLL